MHVPARHPQEEALPVRRDPNPRPNPATSSPCNPQPLARFYKWLIKVAKSGKVEEPLAKMDAPAFTFMGVMLKRRDGAAFFKECFEQIGYALLAHPDAASTPQVAAMVQLALHTMATRLASANLHHFKQTSMLKEAAFYAKAKTNITPVVAAARAMCERTGAPWPRDERFAFMLRYESDANLALRLHYNPKSKHKTNTDLAVDWERFRQLGEETSRVAELAAARETLAALQRDDPAHVPKSRLQANLSFQ